MLTNCAFQDNTASVNGGAMFNLSQNSGSISLTLINCAFQRNTASNNGGAMYNLSASSGSLSPVLINLTNCSFQGNSASNNGGAMYNSGSYLGSIMPTLTNCVVFGNSGANTFGNINTSIAAAYSLFDNNTNVDVTGAGNLTTAVSPFVSASSVALTGCSPAINAGDPSTTTATVGVTDLAGNNRIVGGRIDMGAVEYQGAPNLPIAITRQPATGSAVCAGGSITTSVSVTGTVTGYQWYKDGVLLSPAQSTSALSLTNVQLSDAGSYSVVVTGACNSVTSTAFSLTVNAATFTVSNPAICQGQRVNLGNFIGNKSPITGDVTYFTTQADAQAGTNALISGLVGPVNTPTTYYARYDAAGCFSIQPIMVTLKPALPAPPVLTQDGHAYTGGVSSVTVAQNSESVILAVPGCDGTVAWSGPNNFVSFNSTISVPTSTTGSFTYQASCTSQTACFSGSSQATVTVNSSPQTSPVSFVFTGAVQTFTVPTGVTTLTVVANGARGGGARGGNGGRVTATLSVTPGQLLNLYVGGVPFNGGGSGGGIGDAGGGATDIRIGGTALSNRVLVAGGGGGSGSFIGSTGGGGGLTGGNEAGANGTGGGGGTPVHGGAGSAGGVDGTAGTGGAGANGGGGGGGGGYFGGGGGGPANNGNGGGTGGSGGGGSSYSDPVLVTSVVHTQGANNGNGTITISWSTAPACALSVSISPASQTITSGGSATLTASGATSYVWSNGFTANPLILTNVTSTSTISVTGTTGSCSATATVTLTVSAPGCGAGLSGPIWTGCVSTDWNTAGNWASGTVPTATDDVVIPSGPTNQPILSTTATAKSVEVQSGASLSITAAGSLTINSFATLGGFPTAFYNQGTVSNKGTLMLGNTAPVGLIGLHNIGTFTNTGTLQVDRATNQGINNRAAATFTNTGIITIGASVTMGTQGIWNQATFTHTGGTITIDRITGDGLLNSGNFVNSATITIGASASVTGNGLTNNPGASFTNATGGTITIDRTGVYGLANTFTATFINSSTITIGSLGTIGNYGIVNPGLFTNSACATLTLLAPIFNNSNSFTNAGLLTVNTTRTHIGFGTLTNNGIIDYPQGNPIPNVVNNDVIASVISSCSNTFSPALQLGGNNNQFTVGTTWYTDQGLTQPAGIYNQTSNTFTATNLAPGSSTTLYFAATDNANGCTKTVSVSVTINSVLTASITASPSMTVCQGASVTLTAMGTTGAGLSYQWNNGQTTQAIVINTNDPSGDPGPGGGYSGPGGPQSVTVTNAAGCSASATVTLTINAIPVASISPSNLTVCQGQPASLTASGGSGYLWNTGQTTAIISVTATGTYSVTVSGETGPVGATGVSGGRRSAGEGCFATATSTVTVNPLPANASLSSGTLSCANTSVTLTATGASSYTLSNGQPGSRTVNNTGQFVVNQPGAYTVTIANASGCTATASTSVSSSTAAPVATLVSSGSLSCSVTSVTLTASPSGLSYTFSGPGVVSQGGNMAVVNAAGTYSVTVLSGNGCSSVASTSVSSSTAAPVASLVSSGSLTCSVSSVTLTASGGSAYTFYSPGGAVLPGSGATRVVSSPGSYSVTVSNAGGCTGGASVSVAQDNTAPVASLVSSGSLTCSVTSVTLTASGGSSYTFYSPGGAVLPGSGATRVVSSPGTYSVTVSNAWGCTSGASVSVAQDNTAPVASLVSSGSLTCSVSSVTLIASGGSSYTFYGPGGAVLPGSGNTRVVSSPGTYSVTVANAGGCTGGASVSVAQDNTAPTASLVSSGSLTCSVSSVTLTASGGTSYAFYGPGRAVLPGSGATRVVSSPGTYSVSVSNAGGCTGGASLSVAQDNTAPVASLVSSGSLTCSVTSVTLTASPNGQRYTFGGPGVVSQSGNTALVNASGMYSVTVVNGNGCSAVASIGVSQDTTTPPASLVSSGSLSCAVRSVTLTANAGSGLTYAFSGPGVVSQSGSTAVVNASGTYSVSVTSANGCIAVASTFVSQDTTTPVSSLMSSGNLSCSVSSVTLTASPNGQRYTFSGPGVVSQSGNTALVNASGTYSVTVLSGNGCSSVASTSVSSSTAAPVASLVSSGSLTCSVTSVTLTASGGTSYIFCGPGGAVLPGSGATRVVSSPGSYSVSVSNVGGCTGGASVVVSQDNTAPTASLVSSGSLTCSVTSVTLTASGGTTYTFYGPGVTVLPGSGATRVVSSPGSYSVTVANAGGCTGGASVVVSQDNTAPVASLVSSGSLTCSVSSVTLMASGGSAYTFYGPGGAVLPGSGATRVVSSPGTYSVTVSNAGGCTGGASVVVSQDNTAPTASLVSSGSLTCSVSSVTLTASGGSSYIFYGPGVTVLPGSGATRVVSSPGSYSVTVANAGGCTGGVSVVVSQDNTAPVASLVSSGSLTCSVTSVTLTASGGSAYTFYGPGGAVLPGSGNTRVVSSPGTYSVTVANASGCTSGASVVVSQDNTAPTASLVSSGSLTCSVTSVTLTASPNGQRYRFSGPGVVSQSGNTALVNASGTYSVTVLSANGCSSLASVSVSQDNTAPVASIAANPSLTITQGQSATLTASVSSGASPFTYSWSSGQTTPAISVSTAAAYSVTVTAANGCLATASATLSVTITPVATAPFAITGVLTVDCTPVLPNRFSISFTPQYSGLNGQPISFSIANELLPTTAAGPYSLQLYTDNPILTLKATQAGTPPQSVSFSYNWLAACQASVSANTAPRVAMSIPPQSSTVGVGFSYVIPAGTFTDDQTPGSLVLTASGLPSGLSLSGYTISGTPSTTASSPFSVSITATDPGSLSVSTSFVLTVNPGPATPPVSSEVFSITGVSLLRCTPVADRINISFTPRYAGLNGQAIAFSVVNELAPTTDPAPYSLTLYRDNPVIRLRATQTGSVGEASFDYNWLTACASIGADNTAPRVVNPVGSQTAVVGVNYSLNLSNVFADQETPNGIILTASGLPAGLSLMGTAISGTPSVTGTSTITLTATDPGSLSVSTSFMLTVSPAVSQTITPPAGFAITGVQTVSCVVVSGGQRRVTFTPQYSGLTGQPISFRVVNELAPTSGPGPYSLNLYTDNPVINLRAIQSGTPGEVSYAYNWLSVCGSARVSAESVGGLVITVLGNPVVGETVSIEVRGAWGQRLVAEVVDGQGRSVSESVRESAGEVERLELTVGRNAGVYLLRVRVPGQNRTVKVIER